MKPGGTHGEAADTRAIHFRPADQSDLLKIVALLASCDLPTADIGERPIEFTIAGLGDELIGVVGVEALGEVGLLRSLAVAAAHRRAGRGARLVDHACATAIRVGLKELFLLTTTAEAFFARLGFERVDRGCVPAPVNQSTQFAGLCPASAVCMRKPIAGVTQFFPRESLPMRADASGASYRSVCLARSMLTYFEVPAGVKFERHSHEAEQITMVLEGELVFECDDRPPIHVRAHDVVALPSGVPHAVRAGNDGAKAIDAWSPPHARYAK